MLIEPSRMLAGRVWYTRLFWNWRAWQLRTETASAEGSGGVSVFSNFAALRHRGYADPLFDLHASLAAATPGLVPAVAEDFRQRLLRELNARSCLALFARGDGAVGGYAWGRIASYEEALEVFRLQPSLAHLHNDDWMRLLVQLTDGAPLLVCNDIGLDTRYRRGFAPLKQLLKPLLDLAQRHDVRRAIWWAPQGGALHALSLAFGARALHRSAGITFFALDDIRPLARVLAALPAGEISTLLARVAPARPAPPPGPARLDPARVRRIDSPPALRVVETEHELAA